MPISIIPPPRGATPKEIWEYSERTLTQTKFGFWSEIILLTDSVVSVSADSTVIVDIRPPSGETWFVFIDAVLRSDVAGSYIYIARDCPDTIPCVHNWCEIAGSYGLKYPTLSVTKILTYDYYVYIYAKNSDTSNSRTLFYGYSGFKLSKPLYLPERNMQLRNQLREQIRRMKTTEFRIPDEVEALRDSIVDVYDLSEGKWRQAIILEKDTPLAKDERTGHVIERLSVMCYVDDFINNILKRLKLGQLDLERSGWKKYFEKWRNEGIKVL